MDGLDAIHQKLRMDQKLSLRTVAPDWRLSFGI